MMLDDFFCDIQVPSFLMSEFKKDDWYLVIAHLKEILKNEIPSNIIKTDFSDKVSIKGAVTIGKNCTIGDFVVIDGPVYIGDNVEIGPSAYIRPGSVICDNVSIGHAAQVKNSIMMPGSKVANHVLLADSIIGKKARLGGHCETANRRFDQGEIEFIYKTTKLHTGLDKLGLILGDGARLGGGVFTYPGTMIGKNTFVSTMACIGGYIEPNKFLKFKTQYEILENNFKGELKHTYLFERA
jgi:bifunctional UDP-N-acetylglucosamine pyrophosphorylase/glucosamine-1-phosphate N-acetyltransferase